MRELTAAILSHPLWDILGIIGALVLIGKLLHPDLTAVKL